MRLVENHDTILLEVLGDYTRRFFIYMFYVEFYMFQIEITLHVLRRFYVKHVEKKVLDALPKTVRFFRPGTWKLFLQLF